MLKECVEIPSLGPLLVGAIAFSLAVFQGWFFLRQRQQAWVGWGALVSLAAAFYGVTKFINYNAIHAPLLFFNERLQFTAVIFIIHTLARMIYSLFGRHSPLANRLFLLFHLCWLAIIWLTDLVVAQHLVARQMLWLAQPYIEPALGPLGPFLFLYCFGTLVALYWSWWRNRRRHIMGLNYVVSGFTFWAVLVAHDIWGGLGHQVGAFLMEYGFLGFCFAIAGVSIKSYFILEKSLRQAQKLEVLGLMAAGVAHDFNNLLTVISVNTDLMLTRPDTHAQDRPGLERISEASKRGGDLVRGLVSLGRQGPAQRRPLDLNREIQRVSGMLASTLPSAVTLELDLAPRLPAILGDLAQIEQVLLNLGLNAKDALSRGGRLVIATSNVRLTRKAPRPLPHLKMGDYVLLTVTDTGQGMDERTLERAFDPFFTTKPAGQGSGLGLATVQGIMAAQGGAITCASALGQGAVFSLYWPASPHPLPTPPPASPVEESRQARGRSLLLVDDEIAVLEGLGELLSLHGYRVLKAQSGQEALEVFRAQPVGLVIMDLHMPGMGGPECLQGLLAIQPRVKVIVVSGDPAQARAKLPAGGNVLAHLDKPVRIHQLQALIERALRER
ncbi:MAG: response regulator [Desulfarculus sp.]|nr:response regulator [Desulfarculus sp.]